MYCLKASGFVLLVTLLCIQESTCQSREDEIKAALGKCDPIKACKSVGWDIVGKACVRVFKREKDFPAAKKFCEERSTEMVVPRTAQMSKELTCLVLKTLEKEAHQRVWVGAVRRGTGHVWIYGDKEMKYANWEKDQPDFTAQKEKCIEMNWKAFGKLNDDVCTIKKFVVCQYIQ